MSISYFCGATTIALARPEADDYRPAVAATLIKKYGNRRLYDTGDSRYITLEELAAKIRGGTDVRVVDATDGSDLTQATLTQLIMESGNLARMLPVQLLTQLVRLGDDALGEFFSRYVTAALELYLGAKRGVRNLAEATPLARLPMGADALARMWMNTPMGQMMGFGGGYAPPGYAPPGYAPPGYAAPGYPTAYEPEPDPEGQQGAAQQGAASQQAAPAPAADDLASLRRELDELKQALRSDGGLGKPGAKRKRKG